MSTNYDKSEEPDAVIDRYERRNVGDRYSMLRAEVWLDMQARQRAMLWLFAHDLGWHDLTELKLTDIGCGDGGKPLKFFRFGFALQSLCGIELLPERVKTARQILTASLAVHEGDANAANIPPSSQDVVFQSVMFSSLRDDGFQHESARRMWQWVKPGRGILWHDFIHNNPATPDARGVPVKPVQESFPEGEIVARRASLIPPISRRVCNIHPYAYQIFNAILLLRAHVPRKSHQKCNEFKALAQYALPRRGRTMMGGRVVAHQQHTGSDVQVMQATNLALLAVLRK